MARRRECVLSERARLKDGSSYGQTPRNPMEKSESIKNRSSEQINSKVQARTVPTTTQSATRALKKEWGETVDTLQEKQADEVPDVKYRRLLQ